jgi:hypothetical protein
MSPPRAASPSPPAPSGRRREHDLVAARGVFTAVSVGLLAWIALLLALLLIVL